MKKKESECKMEQERKITYSTYKIDKKTAVVCAVYKSENAPDVNKSLLKLMMSDIKEKSNK